MGSEDYLHALETGKILLFTPLLMSLIPLISGCPTNGPELGLEAGFSADLMIAAGFFTLVYTSILRFRKGLRKE